MGDWSKVTSVLYGMPLALSATLCETPLVTAVLTATEPDVPCTRVRLAEAVPRENLSTVAGAQPGSWKEAIRVRQLKAPVFGRYSPVYQNVQSLAGSMLMLE